MTSPYGTGIVSTFPVTTGNPNVDPFLVWGYKWGSGGVGTSATVTYSFPNHGAAWIGGYLDSEPFTSFTPFTAAQKTAARQALTLWSDVANVSFVEVADTPSNVGDIRFANSGAVTNSSAAAWAYFPYSDPNFAFPEAGDVWFDGAYAPNLQLQRSQFGFATMLHEIGHAIGLDHPFADSPGEVALPGYLDNDRYTVMSYTADFGTLAYASTPQLLDILAIQYIYGANMTTRTGNDVYKFGASTQTNSTIWDAGGVDTFDLSNQTTSSYINLNEGTFSRFNQHAPSGTSSVVAIAFGVTIENAKGGSGFNDITGNAVANMLTGGSGEDTIRGGDGNDKIFGGNGTDYLWGENGDDQIEGGAGIDYLVGHGGDDNLNGGDSHDNLQGQSGKDMLWGGAGDDFLLGYGAPGELDDDYLDGGSGADWMQGGAGNDIYVVDALNDRVDEENNLDTEDMIRASISVDLASMFLGSSSVEHATLFGTAAINATGNSSSNTLVGNDGTNRLDGAGGVDTLIGGGGADTYVVDTLTDAIIEALTLAQGGGVDTVLSSISFNLAGVANVENIQLTSSTNINATGNSENNALAGNEGSNWLDGAGGVDTLLGGKGDDVYLVDGSDIISESLTLAQGGGVDTAVSNVNFSIAAFANVENVLLSGAAYVNATGNSLNNVLVGNSGDNVLDGGVGADLMMGGAGNDTYVVDNVGDSIDEQGNTDINDTVRTSIAVNLGLLGGGAVENAVLLGAAGLGLTGNSSANILTGNDGANTLDGAGGADTMMGGKGNDNYKVDSASDVLVETLSTAQGGGIDTAISAVSFSIAAFANVENVLLIDNGNVNATGNSGNNVLQGNDGSNWLDGGAGSDTLIGGKGDDVYVIDTLSDVISETLTHAQGGGIDTIVSAISFSIAALTNIDNILLNGGANINATGNAATNVLVGNSGMNQLDGGGGVDILMGGAGNDTYVLDQAGDIIDEQSNKDTGDTVRAAFSLNLSALGGGLIEHAVLLGTAAINATGNGASNTLTGNDAANILDGLGGADILVGGKGNDIYVVDDANDVISETLTNVQGGGLDAVVTGIGFNLITHTNVENVLLTGSAAVDATGNAQNNALVGNEGANTLDGGTGIDTLIGNGGADTLIGGIGADVLIGGADRDSFDYNHLNEGGDTITDFVLGVLGDVFDISDLLNGIGYVGGDPFADAVLKFTHVGANTLVSVDSDGAGAVAATNLATIVNVLLTQADIDNYLV